MLLIIFASGVYLSAAHGPLRQTTTETEISTSTELMTRTAVLTSTQFETTTQQVLTSVTQTLTSTVTAASTMVTTTTVTATSTPNVQILVSPTAASPNSSIRVVGKGFQSNSSVTLLLGNAIVSTTLARSDGSFDISFQVPPVKPGVYVLAAKDNFGEQASINFTVELTG